MSKEYMVEKSVIEKAMLRNYIAKSVLPSYSYKTISRDSEKYLSKIVVKITESEYFTIINDDRDFQIPVINSHGPTDKIRNILRSAGFKIETPSDNSFTYINNFINNVNEIVLFEKFENYNGSDIKKRIKSSNTEFNLSISSIFYIKDDETIVERINCVFNVINYNRGIQSFKESVKFKIHGNEFISGSFIAPLEDVRFNFFEKRFKKAFYNYNKDIIKEYSIDINTKTMLNDESNEFEMLKNIVQMVKF